MLFFDFLLTFLVFLMKCHINRAKSSLIFAVANTDAKFVLISASCGLSPNGATTFSDDFNWITLIGNQSVIALSGDPCDCDRILQIISIENSRHLISTGRHIDPKRLSSFCRRTIADKLRSQNRFKVNLLIGGWDSYLDIPVLFRIDEVGAMHNIEILLRGLEGDFEVYIGE